MMVLIAFFTSTTAGSLRRCAKTCPPSTDTSSMIVRQSARWTSAWTSAAGLLFTVESENATGADSMRVASRRGCMCRYRASQGRQSRAQVGYRYTYRERLSDTLVSYFITALTDHRQAPKRIIPSITNRLIQLRDKPSLKQLSTFLHRRVTEPRQRQHFPGLSLVVPRRRREPIHHGIPRLKRLKNLQRNLQILRRRRRCASLPHDTRQQSLLAQAGLDERQQRLQNDALRPGQQVEPVLSALSRPPADARDEPKAIEDPVLRRARPGADDVGGRDREEKREETACVDADVVVDVGETHGGLQEEFGHVGREGVLRGALACVRACVHAVSAVTRAFDVRLVGA